MIEFRILGPVEVLDEGEPVEIPQPRLRALLAILLLHANEIVSTERLIDALWGEEPPNRATNALQASVSRLRKQLPSDGGTLLRTRPPGYAIQLDAAQLDLARFEALAAEGRAALRRGEPQTAARLLRNALALWRGPPLADLAAETFVRREAERLEESRLAALELRIEADLAGGEHAGLVAELESLVASHPYREGFTAQLMLALYRAGRQAEALEAYQRLRRQLVDDLGIEPSRSLQQLERSILQQDPTLELPETAAARLAEGRAARQVEAMSVAAEATRTEAQSVEVELAHSIAELHDARERRGAASGADGTVCPFKGLAPFEEDDAELYFGREQLVSEVVARLASSRLACIVGPSGSGKSSLLRAGVLPALARGILPGSDAWARVVLRPDERPQSALRAALAELGGEPRIVAVDQLEEAFTLCDDERERTGFLDELARLAAGSPRTLVVAAVRADFFGHLASSAALAELLGPGTVLVGAMSEEELRRAIEAPSRRAGLSLEPGLAETLVGEALGEPGALPLLQTTLLELWREREGATLTLRAYGRTGGLRGAIARLAEDTYSTLDSAEQEAARVVLLRLADEEAGAIVRRRASLGELGAEGDPTRARALERLVDGRLVIVDDGAAEVAHEALFREWPRLRAWLDEDAEGRVVRRSLGEAAARWDTGGRDTGDLYRGARLASTLSWAAERPGETTPAEDEFLAASRDLAERESERQRRANRRLRGLLGAALLLLALAVAAGALALAQRSSAREAATDATAQRLGAQALVEGDLDRALLLARQAVDLDSSAQTRGNLLAALLRSPAAIRVLRPLSGRLLGIGASEQAPTVVVESNEGQVAIVDPHAGKTVAVVDGDVGIPSVDGRVVFVYEGDGAYELLDARTGMSTRRARLPGSAGGRTWHVSSDLEVVAIVPADGARVTLWKRAGGEPLGEIAAPSGAEIVDAFLSPDGRRVLTMTVPAPAPRGPNEIDSLTLTVWDASTQEPVRTLPEQQPFPVFAFSPDESVLAVADDTVVRLHDLETGAMRELAGGHTGPITGISFSADGRQVATGADDKLALVWDARSGEILERLSGHDGRVFAPAFGPGGLLYTASLDGSMIAWDLAGSRRLGRPFAAPTTAPGIVPAFDLSPDGKLVAFGGSGGAVEIRDTETLRRRTALRVPEGNATAVAFSPDGRLLAVGTNAAAVLLWDTGTWTEPGEHLPGIERPIEGRATVTSLAFAGGGELLVAGTDEELPLPGSSDPDLDGRVYVWSRETRALVHAIDSPGHVFDVAVTPDGSRVAAIVEAPPWDPAPEAEPMGWAVVWSFEDGEELYRVDADGDGFGRPGGLAFGPDGLLAIGGGDGNVRFADADTGELRGRPVRASAGWVLSIDFAPDGRTLVTGATDGTVRLFAVDRRFQIGTSLPGVDNIWVRALFAPGAGRVLSLHDDGRGFRWDVSPAAWSQRACEVAGRALTEEEWERFLPGRAYGPACAS